MAVTIRTLHVEEFDNFMRYVERAFGHSKGWFERHLPHLYRPTEKACQWAYVVVEDGAIRSHVGVYPIESVTAGLPLAIGGIGAVSTAPEARGKGYMTRLLDHAIEEMRRIGYPASWLGGDRQRYNTFGWENASPVYDLLFTQRSMGWRAGEPVEPIEMEEVYADEALETIRRYHKAPACHTLRPDLEVQMQKADHRFWIAEDGYAVLAGQDREHIRIRELISASGREASMIRALMDWNDSSRANWPLSTWDRARLHRLLPYAAGWHQGYSGMYRVNDLTALLRAVKPHLLRKAAALRNFSVSLALKERDRTTATTITVEDGEVDVSPEEGEAPIELSPVSAARLVIGGPPVPEAAALPEGLKAMLPVPVYVLPLDYV
jgi:predicted acetyltransferase